MAKLPNIFNGMNGRIGDLIFFQRQGRTCARQAPARRPRPRRTEAQLRHRIAWSNLVNLYKAFPKDLKPRYDLTPAGSTHYNTFMSSNQSGQPIYLPRPTTQSGGCVITEVQVSRGELRHIATVPHLEGLATSISLGPLVIEADTTVRQLAQAILQHNPHMLPHDRLLYLLARQLSTTEGFPYLIVEGCELELDPTDMRPLTEITHGLPGFASINGLLGAATRPYGGMVWVHLRRNATGHELCSTQRMVCNNHDLANHYGADPQFRTAAATYGGIDPDPFLKPNAHNNNTPQL